jgi:hypothetical protein
VKARLPPDSKPVGEACRQARAQDAALGGIDRIGHAAERERGCAGIVERECRARITVTRLADRAGIDEEPGAFSELDHSIFVAFRHESFEHLVIVMKDHREMRVAEHAHGPAARGDRAQRIFAVEDVVIFVEGGAVADLHALVN